MAIKANQQIITADFFTNTHRFSASVNVRNRRLTGVLNDRITDYLEITDVYVSRINKPGEILGTYKFASLVKEHITFIVVASKSDSFQEHKYNSFVGRTTEDIFLSVASFEISGTLEIVGKFDLKSILATGTTTFMPVIQAKAINAHSPDINFAGAAIFVNKDAVEFFSIIK